jgi:hypothetical protein
VLLGFDQHSGNLHWRNLDRSFADLYKDLDTEGKIRLSRCIVRSIRNQNPPGRFLDRDSASNLWQDIGDERAEQITSEALQEEALAVASHETVLRRMDDSDQGSNGEGDTDSNGEGDTDTNGEAGGPRPATRGGDSGGSRHQPAQQPQQDHKSRATDHQASSNESMSRPMDDSDNESGNGSRASSQLLLQQQQYNKSGATDHQAFFESTAATATVGSPVTPTGAASDRAENGKPRTSQSASSVLATTTSNTTTTPSSHLRLGVEGIRTVFGSLALDVAPPPTKAENWTLHGTAPTFQRQAQPKGSLLADGSDKEEELSLRQQVAPLVALTSVQQRQPESVEDDDIVPRDTDYITGHGYSAPSETREGDTGEIKPRFTDFLLGDVADCHRRSVRNVQLGKEVEVRKAKHLARPISQRRAFSEGGEEARPVAVPSGPVDDRKMAAAGDTPPQTGEGTVGEIGPLDVEDDVDGMEIVAFPGHFDPLLHQALADVVDPWGCFASAPFSKDPAHVADPAIPVAGFAPTEMPREGDFLLGFGGTARRERVVRLGLFLSGILTRPNFILYLSRPIAIDAQAKQPGILETSSSESESMRGRRRIVRARMATGG